MRILGYLDHPTLKITVFQMDDRLTLKLENGQAEQAFKFRMDGRIETLADIRKLADGEFIEWAQANFQAMHQARLAAINRSFSTDSDNGFDEII